MYIYTRLDFFPGNRKLRNAQHMLMQPHQGFIEHIIQSDRVMACVV